MARKTVKDSSSSESSSSDLDTRTKRRSKKTKEDSSSESGTHTKRRPKKTKKDSSSESDTRTKRRSKKTKKASSSEEESDNSGSSEEDSSSTSDDGSNSDSSSSEESPPFRKKTSHGRQKKHDSLQESESGSGSEDDKRRHRRKQSPPRRPIRPKREVSPVSRPRRKPPMSAPSDSDNPKPATRQRPRSPETRMPREEIEVEAGPSRPVGHRKPPAADLSDSDEPEPTPRRGQRAPGPRVHREETQVEASPPRPESPSGGSSPERDDSDEGSHTGLRSPTAVFPIEPEDAMGNAITTASSPQAKKASRFREDAAGIRKAMAASEKEAAKQQAKAKNAKKKEEDEYRRILETSRREAKKAANTKKPDDEEALRKALAASKLEDKRAAKKPKTGDDDEELRKVLELSKQDSGPSLEPEDEAMLKGIIEMSLKTKKQDEAARQARLKEAREGKKKEESTIISESVKSHAEDRKKRREAEKATEEEFRKETAEAKLANKNENIIKDEQRKHYLARQRQRAREIREEERKQQREEREQQARAAGRDPTAVRDSGQRFGGLYGGPPGRLQPFRDEDNDPAFQEQMRLAAAASLGDAGPGSDPTVNEAGWAPEDMPPMYHERDLKGNKKILNHEQWTTTSRDPGTPGEKVNLTKELRDQMIQYSARMRVEIGESELLPSDKAPKYEKYGTKKEKPASVAALKKVLKAEAPPKTKAIEIVQHQARQPNWRDFGDRIRPQMNGMPNVNTEEVRNRLVREQREGRAAVNRPFRNIPGARQW